ncbi:MAG: anti-sigma factor [Flavobacterium sp.]|nr:MAG: anti-sigma factor [Flavobacterium sp.]
METREYIESGILELYVYGLLSEAENQDVAKMAREHKDVDDEIVEIEKAIVNLSTGFSPYLSAENFARIRAQLQMKYDDAPVIEMKSRRNWAAYTGWAAAILLMIGAGYLFTRLNDANMEVVNADSEKTKLQKNIELLQNQNQQTETALSIVRDNKNTVITLGGQTAAPEAFAKVYWNKETQTVYVDASGLPQPPEGKVYQVWALKLAPQLTPTSIGLLENFTADNHKIFTVSNTAEAEAFGITLEPAGGSESPTMDQLYTLGKV